jgi:hypothetical protein
MNAQSQDRQTYREVHDALTAGKPVVRDFQTGQVVPESLRGKLYSAADLHASAFAAIDVAFKKPLPKPASPSLMQAAE